MRRALACLVVAWFALGLAALAEEKAAANAPKDAAAASPVLHTWGKVSKWDAVSKTFSLKIGKRGLHEAPFVFTEKTKFEGVPAVGETVDVMYVKVGADKFVAEKIKLRSTPPPAK